jgi:hypothetical protein
MKLRRGYKQVTKKPSTRARHFCSRGRNGQNHDRPSRKMVKNRLVGKPLSDVMGKKPSHKELAEELSVSENYTDFDLGDNK